MTDRRNEDDMRRDLAALPEDLDDLYGRSGAETIRHYVGKRPDLDPTLMHIVVWMIKCDRETKSEMRERIKQSHDEMREEISKFNARLVAGILALIAAQLIDDQLWNWLFPALKASAVWASGG